MSKYETAITASYVDEDDAYINLSFFTYEENRRVSLSIVCGKNDESRTVDVDIDGLIWTLKQIKATSAKIREMEENYNPDLES